MEKFNIIAITACLFAGVAFLVSFYYWMTLPIVYVDMFNGECLSVDDVYLEFTCDNPPEKYHRALISTYSRTGMIVGSTEKSLN